MTWHSRTGVLVGLNRAVAALSIYPYATCTPDLLNRSVEVIDVVLEELQ